MDIPVCFGFPILGILSQANAFPKADKLPPRPSDSSGIFDSVKDRFRSRSQNKPKAADLLRNEALEQVNRGWLGQPIELNNSGQSSIPRGEVFNPVFRFPVFQNDKVRAIDDLRHGLVNRFCVIDSPLTLPSWDHLVEVSLSLNRVPRDWAFLKGDRDSAYKNLPILKEHSRFCMITLFNPYDSKWYAFEPKTQIFGSIASVLHYNVFSKLIAQLANLILKIPILVYVGDFGSLVPLTISTEALISFKKFCDILGVKLKDTKCSVSPH